MRDKKGRTCGTYGRHDLHAGRPGGKRPLGRPKLRWENSIKMDYVPEVGWWDMDWIDLAWDSDSFNCYDCGNEPWIYVKCGEFFDKVNTC
jgi:hypothetical protein